MASSTAFETFEHAGYTCELHRRGDTYGYVVRAPGGEVLNEMWGYYPGEVLNGLEYGRGAAREAAEYLASKSL